VTGTDNSTAVHRFLDRIDAGDSSVLDEVFHDDAVIEWPASRERVVGGANRREVYARTPTLPRISQRRVQGSGDLWVAEALFTYGETPYHGVLIFEFRDGKVAKQTGYWAAPSEGPAWRAEWVERIS
jgi:ketosteroid isomerase-like protein